MHASGTFQGSSAGIQIPLAKTGVLASGPIYRGIRAKYTLSSHCVPYIVYYRECPRVGRPLSVILPADLSMRAECMHEK